MTGKRQSDGGVDTGLDGDSAVPDGGTRLDRRTLLRAAAASTATTGLAGCSGDGSGDGTTGNNSTETDTSDPTTTVPSCESYETLEQEDVNGGATIEAGCYRVEKTLAVDSGTLTLEPGVLIEFAEHAGLDVQGDGSLQSKGSTTEPVFLQGTDATRGFWQGLQFRDGAGPSVLENTTVAHAGSALWAGSGSRAAIRVRKATLDVTGSTVRDNRARALNAWRADADVSVSETRFEANEIPVAIHADHVGGFDPNNVVENNDDDRVHVGRDPDRGVNKITTEQDWEDPGVPYYVTHQLKLTTSLDVHQGTTFDFGEQVGLDVDGGTLVAAGVSDDPIRFRGDQSKRGYWQGIQFRNTTARNVIGHAVVKDAGGELWHGADYSKAGVFLKGDDVELVLSQTTIENNDVCGVTATGSGYDLTVGNCEFTNNVEPMRVSADLLMNVEANNTFSGNDGSYVRVGISSDHSGGGTAVVRGQTWRNLAVPYRLNEDLHVKADLTIAPGTTIEVRELDTTNPKVTIDVAADHGGSLNADASGSDEDTIVFTGVENEPGHWGGIGISTNEDNVLRNAVVEYGGGELHNGDTESKACVVPWTSDLTTDVEVPRVTLEQVTLRGSAKHGIYKEGDADVTCSDLTFENIAGADIWDAGADDPVSSC